MDEADRKTLTTHRLEIVKDLEVDELLLSALESKQVLTRTMVESIEGINEKQKSKRAGELINLVLRRGRNAFRNFIEALLLTNQNDLAELLSPSIFREWQLKNELKVPNGIATVKTDPEPTHVVPSKDKIIIIDTKKEENKKTLICDIYPMNNNVHGRAIIINNIQFTNSSSTIETDSVESDQLVSTERNAGKLPDEQLPERKGSEIDTESMINLFQRLKFNTSYYKNCSAEDIKRIVAKEQENVDSSDDAFVFIIMSHGASDTIYGADGKVVNIEKEILEKFDAKNCPALAGKPKLFFVQACQGDEASKGVVIGESFSSSMARLQLSHDPENDHSDAVPSIRKVHEKADFFVAYATVQGFKSFRRQSIGTWFISALAKVFAEHVYTADLLELMTKVSSEVANMRTKTKVQSDNDCLQAPEFKSTLLKKFYFFPPNCRGDVEKLEKKENKSQGDGRSPATELSNNKNSPTLPRQDSEEMDLKSSRLS